MTKTELIKTELFDNIPVRIVEYNGIPMIPVADIVAALSYSRGNISRLMKRNQELFSPYKGVVQMITPGGQQELICLSETGIVGLLIKLDYTRVKDKGFRKKVLNFQQWSFEKLNQLMKGQIQTTALPQSKQSTLDCVNHYLDIADIAVKRSGVPKDIAHKQAWALAGDETKVDIVTSVASYLTAKNKESEQLLLTEAIPQDQADYQSHFSRRQIAEFLKLPDDKVRNILEDKKIIVRVNNIWHLTKFGEQFGKVFYITPQYPYVSAKEARIKYNPDLLVYLKKECGLEVQVTKVQE